jgi:HK97 family phage major capsid protein
MEAVKALIETLGRTFETFKAENDSRLKEIESKGHADPLLADKVDKISADMHEISAMKQQLEQVEIVLGRDGMGGGNSDADIAKSDYASGFNQWFRKGVEGNLADLGVQGAATSGDDPAGGFTVPEEMATTIERIAGTVSAMRNISTVMTIGSSTYKKLVNMGGAASGWVGETSARPETSTPSLVEIAINTKEIYANPAATQNLLDDSKIDIGSWLGNEVAIEFAEQESDAFINGDGVAKPKGLNAYEKVANASYVWGKLGFIKSGAAATITDPDCLKGLKRALKSVYRNGASWLMNDTTAGLIDKMKDSDGQYLWRPGLIENAPDTLLGKPIAYDDNLPDVGAGAFPLYFGNFKRSYLIVDRAGIRVLRDPFTNKPYIMFYTTKRVGGGIIMYEGIKALKISA